MFLQGIGGVFLGLPQHVSGKYIRFQMWLRLVFGFTCGSLPSISHFGCLKKNWVLADDLKAGERISVGPNSGRENVCRRRRNGQFAESSEDELSADGMPEQLMFRYDVEVKNCLAGGAGSGFLE